jgi:site-specific DNA-methyltransferase (adenine-specific)
LWAQIARLMRDPEGPIVLFAAQPFTSALVMSNPKWFRYTWVWEKERGTGHLNARRRPLRRHEDIVVFGRKPPRYYPQRVAGPVNHTRIPRDVAASGSLYGTYKLNASDTSGRKYPQSVLHFAGAPRQGRLHPTEKPLALLHYLVETYTLPGDTVLDYAMGSASTGLACVRAGRHFVGIESDAAFVATARARLAIDLPLAHRGPEREDAA